MLLIKEGTYLYTPSKMSSRIRVEAPKMSGHTALYSAFLQKQSGSKVQQLKPGFILYQPIFHLDGCQWNYHFSIPDLKKLTRLWSSSGFKLSYFFFFQALAYSLLLIIEPWIMATRHAWLCSGGHIWWDLMIWMAGNSYFGSSMHSCSHTNLPST